MPKGPVSTDTATKLQNCIMPAGPVFNQMSTKAGVERHGNKAVDAIAQECKQVDDKKNFKLCNMKGLTDLERKQALGSITLVKEKRCG